MNEEKRARLVECFADLLDFRVVGWTAWGFRRNTPSVAFRRKVLRTGPARLPWPLHIRH
jgi:hypothetical protein